jgi:hypothetical protein
MAMCMDPAATITKSMGMRIAVKSLNLATFCDDSPHQINGTNCSSRRHQNVCSLI